VLARDGAQTLGELGLQRAMIRQGAFSFIYRYILRESYSQFDSFPLTSLMIRQVVERVDRCDAPVQWRCGVCTAHVAAAPGTRDAAPARCEVCLESDFRGGHRGDIRAFSVGPRGERLGLCEEHRCVWLERMLISNSLQRADVDALSKAFVLANLTAELL
jgi:hypothetical protein